MAAAAPKFEGEVSGGPKGKIQKVGGEAALQQNEDEKVILLTQNNTIGTKAGAGN